MSRKWASHDYPVHDSCWRNSSSYASVGAAFSSGQRDRASALANDNLHAAVHNLHAIGDKLAREFCESRRKAMPPLEQWTAEMIEKSVRSGACAAGKLYAGGKLEVLRRLLFGPKVEEQRSGSATAAPGASAQARSSLIWAAFEGFLRLINGPAEQKPPPINHDGAPASTAAAAASAAAASSPPSTAPPSSRFGAFWCLKMLFKGVYYAVWLSMFTALVLVFWMCLWLAHGFGAFMIFALLFLTWVSATGSDDKQTKIQPAPTVSSSAPAYAQQQQQQQKKATAAAATIKPAKPVAVKQSATPAPAKAIEMAVERAPVLTAVDSVMRAVRALGL